MLYIAYAQDLSESDLSNEDKQQIIIPIGKPGTLPDPVLHLWQIEETKWTALCCMTADRNVSEDFNGQSKRLDHSFMSESIEAVVPGLDYRWDTKYSRVHIRYIPTQEGGNGICRTRFASISGNSTSTGYFCPDTEYPDRHEAGF